MSETAQADTQVKPAPPVDPKVEEEEELPAFELPEELKGKVQIDMEEMPSYEEEIKWDHDEL